MEMLNIGAIFSNNLNVPSWPAYTLSHMCVYEYISQFDRELFWGKPVFMVLHTTKHTVA